MLNIEPWIDFIISHSGNKYSKDDEETIFKMVNIMAFILGSMIGEVHERYTAECNVPKEKRPIINMKNEFLYRRLMLTGSKKNYGGIVLLQEGAIVDPKDELDIKGLTIKKSNVNKQVGDEMTDILHYDILKSKDLNISTILKKLNGIEKEIRTSFGNGELTYAKPDKSNEPSTYKTPFRIQAVRGIYAWNAIFPDKEITYPAQVNLVKLKCENLFDLDKYLKESQNNGIITEEERNNIYNAIDSEIFNNPNLSSYGFKVIAIPKNEKKIPEWIIPMIDVDTVIYDSLVNFNKLLESIGVKTIGDTVDTQHYSNIIDF